MTDWFEVTTGVKTGLHLVPTLVWYRHRLIPKNTLDKKNLEIVLER